VTTVLRRPPRRAAGRRRSGGDGARPRRSVARWIWRAGLLAGVAFLIYLAITFVQVWLASRRDEAAPADAIVVLGAAQYDCVPSPVLAQRLDHALELYRDGVASQIVVTGGKQEGDRCTEAETSQGYLVAAGVPSGDITREDGGSNTWESLAAAASTLRSEGLTKAVLVTSGYHALRADAIAGELGLDTTVSPSHKGGSVRDLLEETAAVSLGRIIGFGRLVDIDDQVEDKIGPTISTTDRPPLPTTTSTTGR
jgi:uncharacterized SAM-binding protein YcdF (DUF218 family)